MFGLLISLLLLSFRSSLLLGCSSSFYNVSDIADSSSQLEVTHCGRPVFRLSSCGAVSDFSIHRPSHRNPIPALLWCAHELWLWCGSFNRHSIDILHWSAHFPARQWQWVGRFLLDRRHGRAFTPGSLVPSPSFIFEPLRFLIRTYKPKFTDTRGVGPTAEGTSSRPSGRPSTRTTTRPK